MLRLPDKLAIGPWPGVVVEIHGGCISRFSLSAYLRLAAQLSLELHHGVGQVSIHLWHHDTIVLVLSLSRDTADHRTLSLLLTGQHGISGDV